MIRVINTIYLYNYTITTEFDVMLTWQETTKQIQGDYDISIFIYGQTKMV